MRRFPVAAAAAALTLTACSYLPPADLVNLPVPLPGGWAAPGPRAAAPSAAEVAQARRSVVKVAGVAPSCEKGIEGSGVVYAPERVLTNAHVVAGVTEDLTVTVGRDDPRPARVVLFDPDTDIAVLRVRGLRAAPLKLETVSFDKAVVLGYPRDGRLTSAPVSVLEQVRAEGFEIYHRKQVIREVYTLSADIRPGESGGPVLVAGGRVAGVVFAAASDIDHVGYALTAAEIADEADRGRTAHLRVSTGECD